MYYRIQAKKNVPGRLWDFLLDYVIEVMRIIVNGSRYAQNRTPMEIITVITPDISEYMDFEFYGWIIFRENAGLGPPTLGRWLGVSHRVGNRMTYWVLPRSGRPISCDSVQRCTADELRTEAMQEKCLSFTVEVAKRLDAGAGNIKMPNVPQEKMFDLAKLKKRRIDGRDVCTISSDDYVKAAFKNVQDSIKNTR